MTANSSSFYHKPKVYFFTFNKEATEEDLILLAEEINEHIRLMRFEIINEVGYGFGFTLKLYIVGVEEVIRLLDTQVLTITYNLFSEPNILTLPKNQFEDYSQHDLKLQEKMKNSKIKSKSQKDSDYKPELQESTNRYIMIKKDEQSQ